MTSHSLTVPLDWDATSGDPERPIPFGVNPDGGAVYFDRRTSPHLSVAGGPGTGKTILLQTHIAAGIARHEAFVVVATEGGDLDYEFALPWLDGLAGRGEYEAAAALCESVYKETHRRADLIREHEVTLFGNLPDDVRPPRLTLIVEDVSALVARQSTPCRCPNHHAEDDAVATILNRVSRLAAEARFAGINVIVTGVLDTAASAAIGHANFARLALGRMNPKEQRIALRDLASAPSGFFSTPGQGVYEPMVGPTEAVHCWTEPGGITELTAKLTELSPPRTGA